MDQSGLMIFEEKADGFLSEIIIKLRTVKGVSVQNCSMPQCLKSLKVKDADNQAYFLRLVVIAMNHEGALARLSWLNLAGVEKVCCYLNSQLEAVKRKPNGFWVREKYTPDVMCLQALAQLQEGSELCQMDG